MGAYVKKKKNIDTIFFLSIVAIDSENILKKSNTKKGKRKMQTNAVQWFKTSRLTKPLIYLCSI